jgi:hypothetical protein
MTTAELVACERRLIEAAVARAGAGSGLIDRKVAVRELATESRALTEEQAAAVRVAVSSGDGVTVIEALAGTGKTFTAGALRRVYEGAGYEVIGLAPTGRAARELSERAGIASRTLDRLLVDLEHLDELPRGCVVIFDEAGMAPTRLSARLLQAAHRANAKVIVIGDPGQLASVQAGGWLGAVARELGSVRLTEIMRQRDPAERRALGALHERLPRQYLDWAQRDGRLETLGDANRACERAIGEWARAAKAIGPAQAVMIARHNDTRAALNHAARELRRALGLLGEERSYGPVEVAVGDRVICRRNNSIIDVDNGMRGNVRHVDPDRVVIDTDSRLVRELPASYVSEHLEHAYSLTGHGMQGGTVEQAFVVASPRDLTAGWSYTALSRARGETRLLIYDHQLGDERSEFAPANQTPTVERKALLARVQRRMLERDDEDLAIEQLPPAGRANDPELPDSRVSSTEPPQERAAALAEPSPASTATPSRLRELGERLEQLHAQLEALPTRELERIEHIEERVLALSTQREQLTARLAQLPGPRRRFGCEQDPHAIERAHLTSATEAHDRETQAALTQRREALRELGERAEIRAERDGLERGISQAMCEHRQARKQLVEHKERAVGTRAREVLAERSDVASAHEQHEIEVQQVVRDRVSGEMADRGDALGPELS